MKKTIIYKATDGKRFDSEQECLNHENITGRLDALFGCFPKLPEGDGCKFANGEGYIQHDEQTYRHVSATFYEMACLYHKGIDRYPYDSYGFRRTLDDSGSPFYRYGYRLLNTDEHTLREYGQGYYKVNPQEGKGGQIN